VYNSEFVSSLGGDMFSGCTLTAQNVGVYEGWNDKNDGNFVLWPLA
jgi:hypothetical protein